MWRVKIGDKFYSSDEEPVMIVFDELSDKHELANLLMNMEEDDLKLCLHPDNLDIDEVDRWMKEE